MKEIFFLVASLFLVSCNVSECSFDTLESGVECACEYSERIKAVPGQTSDIQDEVKGYKEAFDEAIESGTFTKETFINKLKEQCPAYLEIIE